MTSKPSYDLARQKEYFGHMSDETFIYNRVLHVLDIISSGHAGLGEVMQGYAEQAGQQLKAIITSARNIYNATESEDDLEVIHHANNVIMTVSKFLELTPAAMKRNNADTIGAKEKISGENIEQLSVIFKNAPETKFLLAYEVDDQVA